jgi:hypothetical protein
MYVCLYVRTFVCLIWTINSVGWYENALQHLEVPLLWYACGTVRLRRNLYVTLFRSVLVIFTSFYITPITSFYYMPDSTCIGCRRVIFSRSLSKSCLRTLSIHYSTLIWSWLMLVLQFCIHRTSRICVHTLDRALKAHYWAPWLFWGADCVIVIQFCKDTQYFWK